jgi:TPR repeat protein
MDKGFEDIIYRIVKEKGKETLVNGNAKLFLTDYCEGQFKKEIFVFHKILDTNCGELINNADNIPELKQKLIVQLEDEWALSPRATPEYLDLLELILKGDNSKCESSVQSASAATSEPAKEKTAATVKSIDELNVKFEEAKAIVDKIKNRDIFLDNATKEAIQIINNLAIYHNHAEAQFFLGNFYFIRHNEHFADNYYRMAAKQGHEGAKAALEFDEEFRKNPRSFFNVIKHR